MDYEQFLKTVFSEDNSLPPTAKKERTAEDIMAEFMPLVEADKKKGG